MSKGRLTIADLPERFREQVYAQLEKTAPAPVLKKEVRIRQRQTPLNKLECLFLEKLEAEKKPNEIILIQGLTLKLANGVRYTPDFFTINFIEGEMLELHAWEVKGPKAWDDAIVKLKVAAAFFPWIQFTLISRKDSDWRMQEILP